jgi:hypothetical protein
MTIRRKLIAFWVFVFVLTDDLQSPERIGGHSRPRRGRAPLDPRSETVSSSVIDFAKRTNAVESGFLAAGITVSAVAVVQSVFVLISWMIFGA